MTVLASVAQAAYAPSINNVPFTVDVNATQVQITLTHPNTLAAWPLGPLVKFDFDWGNGSTGTCSIEGGIRNDKTGVPIVGNVVTTFATSKPPGVTAGTARVTVLQTLTTAVLVEAF